MDMVKNIKKHTESLQKGFLELSEREFNSDSMFLLEKRNLDGL